MPEEKMIELIEWIGQKYTDTNLELHCHQEVLTNIEQARLSAMAKAYKEVWDMTLRMVNNEN